MREPSASSSADNSSRSRQSNFERALENALARHRTRGTGSKHNLKFKCLKKNESPPSTSPNTCQPVGERSSVSSKRSAKSGKAKKTNIVKPPSEEKEEEEEEENDDDKGIDVSSLLKEPDVDYPDLEYPPIFVPEEYSIGEMIEKEQKRLKREKRKNK